MTPRGTTVRGKDSTRSASSANGSEFSRYDKDAVSFLVELSVNNDRDWFKANQERYERSVREPTLALIRAMRPRLARFSKHLVASDQKVGGSMMRPQRDTRFSANKLPYKTNVGVQFRHVSGKDVHAPGVYFHFDPESVFLGVGLWHPEPPILAKLRTHIAKHPKQWQSVLGAPEFRRRFEPHGESLTRAPKGFAPDHPQIELLKRKDHIVLTRVPHALLFKAGLPDLLQQRMMIARDYMRLLHRALELPF